MFITQAQPATSMLAYYTTSAYLETHALVAQFKLCAPPQWGLHLCKIKCTSSSTIAIRKCGGSPKLTYSETRDATALVISGISRHVHIPGACLELLIVMISAQVGVVIV